MRVIGGAPWRAVTWRTPAVCRCLHGPRQLREDMGDTPKRRRSPGGSLDAKTPRFTDQGAAEEVARALKPRLVQKPVFECCPGDGLLSKALLAAGVRNLVLWEPQAKYWETLEQLQSQHNGVSLEKKSFFRAKATRKDEAAYLQPKEYPWNKGVQLQVVGTIHHKDVSIWMARNAFAMAAGSFPHHRGRANLFLLVNGREHQLMVDQDGAVGGMVGPVPRRVIDYQLYYTINTLLKIPKSAFGGEVDQGNVPKTASWDRDHLYLVELTPRPELFTAVCDKDTFSSFLTFNQQLFRVRRAPLVPRLEHWCPGLGLVAIDLGYSMIDTVKQLQAHHLPIIFKELQQRGGLEALSMASHDDLYSESTAGVKSPISQESITSSSEMVPDVNTTAENREATSRIPDPGKKGTQTTKSDDKLGGSGTSNVKVEPQEKNEDHPSLSSSKQKVSTPKKEIKTRSIRKEKQKQEAAGQSKGSKKKSAWFETPHVDTTTIPDVPSTRMSTPKVDTTIPDVQSLPVSTPKVDTSIPDVPSTRMSTPKVDTSIPDVTSTRMSTPKVDTSIPDVISTHMSTPKVDASIPDVQNLQISSTQALLDIASKSISAPGPGDSSEGTIVNAQQVLKQGGLIHEVDSDLASSVVMETGNQNQAQAQETNMEALENLEKDFIKSFQEMAPKSHIPEDIVNSIEGDILSPKPVLRPEMDTNSPQKLPGTKDADNVDTVDFAYAAERKELSELQKDTATSIDNDLISHQHVSETESETSRGRLKVDEEKTEEISTNSKDDKSAKDVPQKRSWWKKLIGG